MPRKLPWQQGSATNVARPKRSAASANPSRKRPKVEKSESDSEVEDTGSSPRKKKKADRARTPSTSPPPEPPVESFMDEGVEHDDKYRMVEDEFLTVAQKFTVHLHAAEYKRQEKMVKARNAEAIHSISRPVTGRMPDHTKRKVQSIARSKTQRSSLQGLFSKRGDVEVSDDSDEGDGLPYVETTLHGLMESPRRRAASLGRVGSNAAITRAAAGFRKPAAHSKSPQKIMSQSPVSKLTFRSSQTSGKGSPTESSDDDDDLDAHIPTPKLTSLERKETSTTNAVPNSRSILSISSNTQPSKSFAASKSFPSAPSTSDEVSSRTSHAPVTNSRAKSDSSSRLVKRLEQARLQKATREKEEQKKKKLDIIPTFL